MDCKMREIELARPHPGPLPQGLSLRTLLITLYLYINRLCILWRDA